VSVADRVETHARRAKAASRSLQAAGTEVKNEALAKMAELLRARQAKVLRANAIDMENGENAGLSSAMLDRLQVFETWTRPNGLRIEKVRVPLGVVGIIYESRPNVTVDAAGLCLKAGNAVLLRGGKEAINSNIALAEILGDACQAVGLPESCVEILDFTDREAVTVMARMDQYLSLIVPRGGKGLIQAVTEAATVPVLAHDRGMTQIYVDESCDLQMAVKVVHNSKVQRPGVCNAVENLYVHEKNEEALRAIVADLQQAGVEIRGCPRTVKLCPGVVPATAEDWDTEYLDLILSVMVVGSLDEALEQIALHTSGLTEAILTDIDENAERFLREVDSACVYHNASTRFTDGGQFGMGAEIGISTGKLHARGPVGVRELTTYKYVVHGEGQVRT